MDASEDWPVLTAEYTCWLLWASELTYSSVAKVHLSLGWVEHSKPKEVFGSQHFKKPSSGLLSLCPPHLPEARDHPIPGISEPKHLTQCFSHGKCFINFCRHTVVWGPCGNGEEAMERRGLQWRSKWLNGWLHTDQEAKATSNSWFPGLTVGRSVGLLIGREYCMRNMATLGFNHRSPCSKRDGLTVTNYYLPLIILVLSWAWIREDALVQQELDLGEAS